VELSKVIITDQRIRILCPISETRDPPAVGTAAADAAVAADSAATAAAAAA